MSEQSNEVENEVGISLADVLAHQPDEQTVVEATPASIVLHYVGNAEGHGYHVEGVPACDLTQDMIAASGYTLDDLLAFNGPVYAPAQE